MNQWKDHFCRYSAEYHKRSGSYCAGTNVGFPSIRLAYILNGSCRVENAKGEVLHLKPGDVWYIPKGLPYSSHWTTADHVSFVKLEFEADDFSLQHKTMQVFRLPELEYDFKQLCNHEEQTNCYGSLSSFYHILSTLSPHLKQEKNTALYRILPALKYLQQQDLAVVRVKELAAMCCMSSSRFYQEFRKAVGDSPINYKNKIKLSYAKILLQEGRTLDEVCDLLHFSSPSFLRRIMKKHLGITPKEAKQRESI